MLWLLLGCASSPSDAVEEGACPSLMGFQDRDQEWVVHELSEDAASGGWSRTVRVDQDVVTVARVGHVVSHDGAEIGLEDVRTYLCDDEGVWWTERALQLELPDRTSIEHTLWEIPPLMMRWDAAPGDMWTGNERYVLTINGEPDAPLEQAYAVELGGAVSLTVPAGTFEVVEWRKGALVELLAPDLGVIRDLDGHLVTPPE